MRNERLHNLSVNSPATSFKLNAAQLLPLTPRSNAAAARRAAGHLGAIVLCAAALWAVLGSRSGFSNGNNVSVRRSRLDDGAVLRSSQ